MGCAPSTAVRQQQEKPAMSVLPVVPVDTSEVKKRLKVILDHISDAGTNPDHRAKVQNSIRWLMTERVFVCLRPKDNHALLVRAFESLLDAIAQACRDLEYHVLSVLLADLVAVVLHAMYGLTLEGESHYALYGLTLVGETHNTPNIEHTAWANKVQSWSTNIRATIKATHKFSDVPTSELLTQLVTLEDGVALLNPVSKSRGVMTVGKFLGSLGKSIMTMHVDKDLLANAKEALKLGVQIRKRSRGKCQYDTIWRLHQLQEETISCMIESKHTPIIKTAFLELQEQVATQFDSAKVMSAWIKTIGSLACRCASMKPNADAGNHLAKFFVGGSVEEGGTKAAFQGLLDYASFGDDTIMDAKYQRAIAIAEAVVSQPDQTFGAQIEELIKGLLEWVREQACQVQQEFKALLEKVFDKVDDVVDVVSQMVSDTEKQLDGVEAIVAALILKLRKIEAVVQAVAYTDMESIQRKFAELFEVPRKMLDGKLHVVLKKLKPMKNSSNWDEFVLNHSHFTTVEAVDKWINVFEFCNVELSIFLDIVGSVTGKCDELDQLILSVVRATAAIRPLMEQLQVYRYDTATQPRLSSLDVEPTEVYQRVEDLRIELKGCVAKLAKRCKKSSMALDTAVRSLPEVEKLQSEIRTFHDQVATFRNTVVGEFQGLVARGRSLLFRAKHGLASISTNMDVSQANELIQQLQNQASTDIDVDNACTILKKAWTSAQSTLRELGAEASKVLGHVAEACVSDVKHLASDLLGGAALDAFSDIKAVSGVDAVWSFAKDKLGVEKWRIRSQAMYGMLEVKYHLTQCISNLSDGIQESHVSESVNGGSDGKTSNVLVSSTNKAVDLLAIVDQVIIKRTALETQPEIKHLVQHPEHVTRIKAAATEQWQTVAEQVQHSLKDSFEVLDKVTAELQDDSLDPARRRELTQLWLAEHDQMGLKIANLSEMSDQMGIAIDFLRDMRKALFRMEEKLDVIVAKLKAMDSKLDELLTDTKRMAGKPILEKADIFYAGVLKRASSRADNVRIEIDGLRAGPARNFQPCDDLNALNQPFGLVEELAARLSGSDGATVDGNKTVGIILVSGPSGSGKSTVFVELETKLAKKFKSDNLSNLDNQSWKDWPCEGSTTPAQPMQIVVRITLPELQDPLTDMVEETLRNKWNCTATQIHELRQLIEDGKCKLTFLVDGYDELKPDFLYKNLFKTNNLERWRSRTDSDDSESPRVVIFTRSELLAGRDNYTAWFLPNEADNQSKDATNFFEEYRIAQFTKYDSEIPGKVDEYIKEHVKHETQQLVLREFDAIATGFGIGGQDWLSIADQIVLLKEAATTEAESEEEMRSHFIKLLTTPFHAPNVNRENSVLLRSLSDEEESGEFAEDTEATRKRVQAFVKDKVPDSFWNAARYFEKFETMEELQELTKTAFMMKILSTILPRLVAVAASPMAIKRELILLLDGDKAEEVMTVLRRKGIETREQLEKLCEKGKTEKDILRDVVEALDPKAKTKQEPTSKKGSERETVTKWQSKALKQLPKQVAILNKWQSKADSAALAPALARAFRRRPLTRFAIFAEFVTYWVDREAKKLVSGAVDTVLSVDDLLRDAPRFAEALAVEMTRHNQPKVLYEHMSQLAAIKVPSVWDQFFEEDRSAASGHVLTQVRKASPISQSGNVYAMVHKSIQEYLVAKRLVDEVQQCVASSRIRAETLRRLSDRSCTVTEASADSIAQWIDSVALSLEPKAKGQRSKASASKTDDTDAAERRKFVDKCKQVGVQTLDDLVRVSDASLKELGLESLSLRIAAMRSLARHSQQGDVENVARQLLNDAHMPVESDDVVAIARLVQLLESSVLNTLQLAREEAVIDFALDQLLADLALAQHFVAMARLCLRGDTVHGGRLALARQSVFALCLAPIARRDGQCLGHLAAAAGSTELLALWVDVAASAGEWATGQYRVRCATTAARMAESEIESRVLRFLCPEGWRERFGSYVEDVQRIFETEAPEPLVKPLPKLSTQELQFADAVVARLDLASDWARLGQAQESQLTKVAERALRLILNTDEIYFDEDLGLREEGEYVRTIAEFLQQSLDSSQCCNIALVAWRWLGDIDSRSPALASNSYHSSIIRAASAGGDEVGLPVDVADGNGQSVLTCAVINGDASVVRLLLEAKAAVDATDDKGWRVLMHAAQHNHVDCIECLLDHGASITGELSTNGDDQSALWVAAHHGAAESCKVLLAAIHNKSKAAVKTALVETTDKANKLTAFEAAAFSPCRGPHVSCAVVFGEAYASHVGDTPLSVKSTRDRKYRKEYTLTLDGQIDLSDEKLGPFDAGFVAGWLKGTFSMTSVNAALAHLDCSQNDAITGKRSRDNDGAAPWIYGEQLDGWIAMCTSLPNSSITSLNFSACQLQPKSLTPLADAIKSMAASVEVVILDGNPIGGPSAVTLKPGAVTGVDVKKGVFGSNNGRFAEILEDPDRDSDAEDDEEVEIRWLDTGEEDDIEMNQLTSIVAARTDLIEDYSHIRSLGEGLSSSKMHTFGLADCNFTPATLATFVESVRWDIAVINEVNVSLNPIGVEGAEALAAVIPKSSLQVIILGTACKIKEGVNTVAATRGAFAIMDGRGGELTRDPDSDREIKLRWLDDGSESRHIKVDRLSSVVSSRADLLFGTQVPVNNSEVTELNFSCQNFGVAEVTVVAAAISTNAAMKKVALSGNPLTGGKSKQVSRTKCIQTDGKDISGVSVLFPSMTQVTELDVSDCGLGPTSMPELAKLVSDATAALTDVNMSGNPLTGKTFNGKPADGKDISGVSALFPVMTKVIKLNVSECGLGPTSMPELAKLVCDATAAALTSLTVDSTGVPKLPESWMHGYEESGPRTYTLTVGEDVINLSKKNLGPADVTLLTVWIQRHEVSAVVTSINCLANQFGDEGLATLLTAIKGTSVRSLCGLTEGQTAADFSGQNLGPIDCKIISAEFEFRGFIAVLASLNLSGNKITDNDRDLSGLSALGEAIVPSKKLTYIDLSRCGIKVEGVTEVAKFISAGAASVNLSGNHVIDQESRSTLQESVSSRQPTIELIWDK